MLRNWSEWEGLIKIADAFHFHPGCKLLCQHSVAEKNALAATRGAKTSCDISVVNNEYLNAVFVHAERLTLAKRKDLKASYCIQGSWLSKLTIIEDNATPGGLSTMPPRTCSARRARA